MEARSLPEALNMIMEQRGCTQTQLARDLDKHQPWISNVINGSGGRDFAKVINTLARVGWEVVIRPKSPKREELDPVKRRDFTQRAITVGAVTAVEAARSAAFIPSPTTDPFKNPIYIRSLAVRLAEGTREHGGVGMLPAASRAYKRIQSVSSDGNDPKVLEASTYLARQIAWTLQDACRFDAAENVGRFALELAVWAKDAEAQALACRLLSNNNVEWGRADHAIKYAEHGLRLHGISELPQAQLSVDLARSLALARSQERYVRKAVESALSFNSLPPFAAAGLPGDAGNSLATMASHAQSAELRQSYSRDAYESIEQTVASMALWPAVQADYLGGQIRTALRANDHASDSSWLPRAADRMVALAHAAPLVSSTRVDRHVTDILAATAQWHSVREVRDARDLLRSVAPAAQR